MAGFIPDGPSHMPPQPSRLPSTPDSSAGSAWGYVAPSRRPSSSQWQRGVCWWARASWTPTRLPP